MAKVLVIGGCGYVGTELIRQLKANGDQVCIFDRIESEDRSVESIVGDFTDAQKLNADLGDRTFEVIYHIASLPGDTGDPHQMMRVNVLGLMNMLEWARQYPVNRFVVTSSISAMEWYPATKFSPPKYMPVDEAHPCQPKDMYSTTKRMQELLALTYYHEFEVPTTVLRLTAVVGPAGKGGGRGYREMAKMMKDGKKLQIPHFSRKELCHYVDIRDVARMQIAVAEHPKAVGEIFNCCAKEPTRGREFIDIVESLVPGIEVECGFAWSMAQGGEIAFSMEKAKKLIGFEPQYSLEDAVRSIKDWIDAEGLESDDVHNLKYTSGVEKQ